MRIKKTCKFFNLAFLTILLSRKFIAVSCEPEKGLITQILQISKTGCITACNRRKQCLTAKYVRASAFCTLYSEEFEDLQKTGIIIYRKTSFEQDPLTEQCYENCDISVSCGPPKPLPGTKILGNMVDVGSKVKYVCIDGTGAKVSECLSNGTWSHVNLRCENMCFMPASLNGVSFKNVVNWHYAIVDDSTVSGVAECPENCKNPNQRPAICNRQTGHWSLMSDICCNQISKSLFFKS